MTASTGHHVRILLRPECHLCHEVVERIGVILGPDTRVTVEHVDIESDRDLLKRNLERIPVVEVDGRVVSELEFDEAAFLGAIGPAREFPAQ